MNIGIYFNEEEAEFIKTMPQGYVRSLVRDAMGDPNMKALLTHPPIIVGVGSEMVVPTVKMESHRNTDKYINPFLCKECGHTKCAGRCINKNCKLSGKLQ